MEVTSECKSINVPTNINKYIKNVANIIHIFEGIWLSDKTLLTQGL